MKAFEDNQGANCVRVKPGVELELEPKTRRCASPFREGTCCQGKIFRWHRALDYRMIVDSLAALPRY